MSRKSVGLVLIILGAASLFIGFSYFFVAYFLDPKHAIDTGEKWRWVFTLEGILGLILGWVALKGKP